MQVSFDMKKHLIAAAIIFVCMAILFIIGCRRYVHSKDGMGLSKSELRSKTNFITFSKIDKAHNYSKGEGVKIAVCDWLFDLRGGEASKKYLNPSSMIPGQPVGSDEPWHGEWMSEMVHQTAPDCQIIPIRARTADDDYQQYLIKGIRFAADQGAAAVTSSMGPLFLTVDLRKAVDYATAKGTLFINVHPIEKSIWESDEISHEIICTGLVSVPGHRALPEPRRDIYVWPYSLTPTYKDGWGYSNGPPIVAGVVALMKSANPALTPREIKQIIATTAFMKDGFRALDAEAAVLAAMRSKREEVKP